MAPLEQIDRIKQSPGEIFAAANDEISFVPSTLDASARTVDVVWYGGATVPRVDPDTGEPFMLRLDMAGCRMERLNAGAPVFDCHMTGLDYRSAMANQLGAKAQRGSVVKAWADGPKGMATLQFGVEGENEDTDQLWSAIGSGRVRNLSFGTWIYAKAPAKDVNGNGTMAPQPLNEKGEYHRANLTDSNISYSLATFGEIVALTRKVIINDDVSAFTRVPALLGVAAARLQSDKVWGVITSNPVAVYTGDAVATALFAAAHKNLNTGAGSALALAGMATGRQNFRLQTAPQGTPLNLTPRYIVVPAALETAGLQLISPLQLAATAITGVVPAWVQSLVPIVEPRLDPVSETAWYLIADPADIDTVEYCFLEGQEGVYFETRQGFEVDGIEMKARMDFAAAAIDYRGLQENAGV